MTETARQLRELRKQRGMTTEDMADALGTAVQNYRRMETGGQNLTLKTIERLAKVLEVVAKISFEDARE